MKIYNFDNSIYNGNSMIDFYVYCVIKKPSILRYFPLQAGSFLLYLLGIFDRIKFKKLCFKFLNQIEDIDLLIGEFWIKNSVKIKKWYKIQKNNTDLIISSSAEFLLRPICDELNLDRLIATRIDKYSGELISNDCIDEEGLRRFNKLFKGEIVDEFYSDSINFICFTKIALKNFVVDGNTIYKWNDYKPSLIQKFKQIFLAKDFFMFLVIGVINTMNSAILASVYSFFIKMFDQDKNEFVNNVAFVFGYLTALIISYLLNSMITFKEKLTIKKLIKYCISYIPNFIIQVIAVFILYNGLGINHYITYALAAIIGVPVTFILMKIFAFNKKTKKTI